MLDHTKDVSDGMHSFTHETAILTESYRNSTAENHPVNPRNEGRHLA